MVMDVKEDIRCMMYLECCGGMWKITIKKYSKRI
jgi:hypothetical protein